MEDDTDDQELLIEALRALDPDIQLISFTTGIKFIEALDAVNENELPSLIVLDYNIPDINGAGILQRLNQNKKYDHINKVIWSTSNSERFKTICLQLGAKDYIIKPSSLSETQLLAEKILRFFNRH